jgi:hypothetical protein
MISASDKKNFIRLLSGALVVFLTLSVLSGGFYNASQLIFLSVVCTLGISLFVWISVSWVVGWIVVKIFDLLMGQGGRGETLERTMISLVNYIEKCHKQGWSDTQISSRLKAQGWQDEEIEHAQNVFRQRTGES